MQMPRACELLEISLPEIDHSPGAPSTEEQLQTWKDGPLKQAWKKAARKYHPDLNRDNPEQAEARFKEASDAYDLLQNVKISPQRWTHEDAADAFSTFEDLLKAEVRKNKRARAQATAAREQREAARRQQQEEAKRKLQQEAERLRAEAERAKRARAEAVRRRVEQVRRAAEDEIRRIREEADAYDGPDHAEHGEEESKPRRRRRKPAAPKAPSARAVGRDPKVVQFPGAPPPPAPRAAGTTPIVVVVMPPGSDVPEQGIDLGEVVGAALDVGSMLGLDAALGFPGGKKALNVLKKLIK